MRYIYYIIIILVIITGVAGWGIFNDAKVEFSKPVIVINDRIVTEHEFDDLIKTKPIYYSENEFIDFIIEKEILIQEAIKRNINKHEPFRASVEDFYEQSLIKILMDRQYKEFNPDVSENEIEKYISLTNMKIVISKMVYEKKEDIGKKKSKDVKIIESDFLDLSESLQFIVFNLKAGESSKGFDAMEGFVVYSLTMTEPITVPANDQEPGQQAKTNLDNNEIAEFIKNGKKEALLAEWVDGLKEKAEIWRRK
jgi:hypothetical protein